MMTVLAWAFWISGLLLVQVFVGYPLGITWWARRHARTVAKQVQWPSVTVILAVHNGAAELETKLANLAALDYPADALDIVVASDGSSDGTAGVARRCGGGRVAVLEFADRRGKAACLNDAVAAARGDVLLMTDVRQRLEPQALRELVANLADPAVGAVSGELCLEDAQTGFARSVDAYWRYEKRIRHAESASGSVVGVTGALYAIRRAWFQPLPPGTVLDDVLVPMRVVAAGKRVVCEPLAVAWDRPSQQPAEERRRKVRTLAGNYQLLQLAPWLLAPWRNPVWWRFVCHKLLRLLAPWLMVVMLAAALALAATHWVYALASAGALLAIVLVVIGRMHRLAGRWPLVRVLTAFAYLNVFAAQGLFAFLSRRRLHLW